MFGFVLFPNTPEEYEAYDRWMSHRDLRTPGIIFLALFTAYIVWLKWREINRFRNDNVGGN